MVLELLHFPGRLMIPSIQNRLFALTSVLACAFFLLSISGACQSLNEPRTLWKFQAHGEIVASPVLDGKNLMTGSYDSTFYNVDAISGKVNWTFKSGGQIGSTACIWRDKVMFFSSDGKLYCLDKTNGSVIWMFKTFSGALPDRKYDWPDYYQSSPITDTNTVFFGAGDGRVYAVNALDGNLKWSYQTGDVVHTRPAIENDKIVIGSFDGTMYCLNKESGTLIWQFKTTGHRYFPRGEINGDPVIHHNKVLFGARDYNLYALDLNGGYCHWLKTFSYGWALPVTANDSIVYVGTSDDRMLLALNEETGVVAWRTNLGFNNFAGIMHNKRYGYTGTLNGKLFCIDLTNGAIRWTFLTDGYKRFAKKYFEDGNVFVKDIATLLPNGKAILTMYRELGAIFSTPVLAGDRIFLASNDGTIYCLGI